MQTPLSADAPLNADAQMPSQAHRPATEDSPWWRHPMVWLVAAGPLLVVVAGFWTLYLAISHPDPVVHGEQQGRPNPAAAETPAQQARNHAATSRVQP